jgi:hypothetical protein
MAQNKNRSNTQNTQYIERTQKKKNCYKIYEFTVFALVMETTIEIL